MSRHWYDIRYALRQLRQSPAPAMFPPAPWLPWNPRKF